MGQWVEKQTRQDKGQFRSSQRNKRGGVGRRCGSKAVKLAVDGIGEGSRELGGELELCWSRNTVLSVVKKKIYTQ